MTQSKIYLRKLIFIVLVATIFACATMKQQGTHPAMEERMRAMKENINKLEINSSKKNGGISLDEKEQTTENQIK
jgi:hypothetical protein